MSAIEQPAAMFGSTTFWSGPDEDVGGLRHEVHAAEDDVLGVLAFGGELRELERVAPHVGELDDVLALVVVAEHDGAVAEPGASRTDARRELLGRERPVLLGDVLLPARERALFGERYGLEPLVRLADDVGQEKHLARSDGAPLGGDAPADAAYLVAKIGGHEGAPPSAGERSIDRNAGFRK